MISPEVISSWAVQGLGHTASYLTSQGKKDTAASALSYLPSHICPGPWRVLRVLHQHPDPPQQHLSARVLVRFSRNKSEGLRVPAIHVTRPCPLHPHSLPPAHPAALMGRGWGGSSAAGNQVGISGRHLLEAMPAASPAHSQRQTLSRDPLVLLLNHDHTCQTFRGRLPMPSGTCRMEREKQLSVGASLSLPHSGSCSQPPHNKSRAMGQCRDTPPTPAAHAPGPGFVPVARHTKPVSSSKQP